MAGQLTRQLIEQEMNAPGWSSKSSEEKVKAVDEAKKLARKQARDLIIPNVPNVPTGRSTPSAAMEPALPPGYVLTQ